jgi:hypothetical protein
MQRLSTTDNFLSQTAFISDCATQSIKASIPSFACMWTFETTNSISPKAIFCTVHASFLAPATTIDR